MRVRRKQYHATSLSKYLLCQDEARRSGDGMLHSISSQQCTVLPVFLQFLRLNFHLSYLSTLPLGASTWDLRPR